MKTLLSWIGSMKTMAVLLLVFAVSIGYATFIENDYGTMSAKADVYNARWFEFLLGVIALNLVINILQFKMARTAKWAVFLFHFSFLVILIGAAVTRYVGYEGSLSIREGQSNNQLISLDPYISITHGTEHFERPLYLSSAHENHVEFLCDGMIKVHLERYLPHASYAPKADPKGESLFKIMMTTSMGAQTLIVRRGDAIESDDMVLDFDSGKHFDKPVVHLSVEKETPWIETPLPIQTLSMDTQQVSTLAQGRHSATQRTLFQAGRSSFVIREFLPHASLALSEDPTSFQEGLVLRLEAKGESQKVVLLGKAGEVSTPTQITVGGEKVTLAYGSVAKELPFSLFLRDFELTRYPGSMSPSSYASVIRLLDPEKNKVLDHRIYMNHVLDYRGYRFFQSSYDPDERGTILSVNHDPGTWITYVGYFLLALGMIASIFTGRFVQLSGRLRSLSERKAQLMASLMMVLLFSWSETRAAENPVLSVAKSIDATHADHFGHLIVQDTNGRMKPIDTLSRELLSKLYRGNSLMGLSANQVILGMMVRPEAWQEIAMIRTRNETINQTIGLDPKAKNAAFSQFFSDPAHMGGYKLTELVETASRKAPKDQDKLDKAVLEVDERVNVAYMIYSGSLIRMWPLIGDPNHKWNGTIEALQSLPPKDAQILNLLIVSYFKSIDQGISTHDWSQADQMITLIDRYQRALGKDVYPSQTRIEMEILYNQLGIFETLWPFYFGIGFVMLIALFIKLLSPQRNVRWIVRVSGGVLGVLFVAHTIGLAMRWYIAEHAPWSDGYESMIYIAWASMAAGLIFARRSMMALALSGVLSGLILFVAHLNFMNPQVTNLVPVLQSYWLSIHVSMITASYGFLGLGALLGWVSLALFIAKTPTNQARISLSIQELNVINEMSLIIGLIFLTIGNFLGGVWANESWGRYWGWDPKETWALVTILVYAVVLHVRYIRSIYSEYLYSVLSLVAISAVVMTYFGVNYYLAGMHSYAKGDPLPIPMFVPITYAVIAVMILLAWPKRRLALDKA